MRLSQSSCSQFFLFNYTFKDVVTNKVQSGDKDQMTTENAAQVPSFKSMQKTSALILNCLLTSAAQLSYLLSIYYFFPALVDTSSTKRGILTT